MPAVRDAAAARVVGHQDEITPGERDVGRERRALVAAFVLVDLDDQLVALAQMVLRPAASIAVTAAQVLPRDFLERKEAVAVGAVVDETSFQAWLDAGNDRLVDVALALLLARRLDVEVDQLLAVDDRHAQLLGLRGVEQHAFHRLFPGAGLRGARRGAAGGASKGAPIQRAAGEGDEGNVDHAGGACRHATRGRMQISGIVFRPCSVGCTGPVSRGWIVFFALSLN
jgi:hypothetical protein